MREVRLKDVANVLGISPVTLAHRIKKGRYPFATSYTNPGSQQRVYIFTPSKFREFFDEETYQKLFYPEKEGGANDAT